jgi:hypothetical protein
MIQRSPIKTLIGLGLVALSTNLDAQPGHSITAPENSFTSSNRRKEVADLSAAPPRSEGISNLTSVAAGAEPFARGTDLLVRVSQRGGILTSKDGAVWDEQRLLIRTFLRSVTFGRDVFVAAGGSYIDESGVVLTSRDGTNWVRRNVRNKINLHSVAYGNGLFVAVGDEGAIFTSADGGCWKKRHSGTSALLSTVSFGHAVFVAGGESGTIVSSTNAADWSVQALGNNVFVSSIVFRESAFEVANSDVTFISTNGREWSRREIRAARIP